MLVYGRNTVREFLENNIDSILEIYVSDSSSNSGRLKEILTKASKNRLKINFLPVNKITALCNSDSHQGIVAKVKDFEYSDLNTISNLSKKNANRFVLILDHIEDPHNLGAIIRTANFFGVDGIILPKDRAAGVTPAVMKVSSGAASYIQIARVSNLGSAIGKMKDKGFWIVGTDVESNKTFSDSDLSGLDVALIIGSEGKGMKEKIREKCDLLISIPRYGKVKSLNASVAAGILIYELKKIIKR